MKFAHGYVDCLNRKDIPPANETIADDMNIDEVVKVFKSISIYFRNEESCPFNRGNWIIDFLQTPEQIVPLFSIKLPAEMKRKDVMRWAKPLMDRLKEQLN